ncbi:hypothetical protein ACQ4M4_08325 [Leptolyngbya sp. AN02str]|uniref:hypothetical protein n=1 Tax=Leptolyngbya sp. AN02str TaxID=3423363 RepID=UPI003D3105F8
MKDKLLNGLNTLLMINIFVVLGAFAWFAIALVGRSMDIPLGFDIWYKLWQPVIQPALGILMLGAIVSGIAGWVNKKLSDRQSLN